MIEKDFVYGLEEYLRKAELEYRAKNKPEGSCCEWLACFCESTESICLFLRSLGFRIKETVSLDGGEWVVTTSGVIVYVNFPGGQGFVVGTGRSKR